MHIFFSHQDLNILKICKVDYVKVPSGEINNTLLLKEISKLKKKNYHFNWNVKFFLRNR